MGVAYFSIVIVFWSNTTIIIFELYYANFRINALELSKIWRDLLTLPLAIVSD